MAGGTVEAGRAEEQLLGKTALAHLLHVAGDHVDLLMATRAAWGVVVALWVSRRFDAALVVLLVSMVACLAAFPVLDQVFEQIGPFLPGVKARINLSHLAAPFARLSGNPELATALLGVAIVAIAAIVGWLVSKRSPVVGLMLYVVTFIVSAQSAFFEDYPARLGVPIFLLAVSVYSKHIRYLNIASAVFATMMISAANVDDEPPALKELIPQALWAGFALLVVHDVLVRAGIVEWVSLVAESGVLVFTFVIVVQMLLGSLYDFRFQLFDAVPLTWPNVAHASCLPGCVASFEAAIPGVFCTFFCVVTILRNVVGRKCSLAKSLVSAVAVGGAATGLLAARGQLDLLLQPNVTSVVAALALVCSERFSSIKDGFASKDSALVPPKHGGVGYHVMVYWSTSSKSRDQTAEEVPATGPAAEDEAQEDASRAEVGALAMNDKAMEEMWRLVKHDFDELEKAKKIHRNYQQASFQQEAIANAIVPYDAASEATAVREKAKAEQMNAKCRESSNRVKQLERKAKLNERKAREMEQHFAAAQKKDQ